MVSKGIYLSTILQAEEAVEPSQEHRINIFIVT